MTIDRHLVTLYDPVTGEILNHCNLGMASYDWYVETNVPFVEGTFGKETHYVSEGVAVQRPDALTTLTGTSLSNLPIGGTLYVNGEGYPITEGTCDLTLPIGHYTLKVVKFPYVDQTFEVSV